MSSLFEKLIYLCCQKFRRLFFGVFVNFRIYLWKMKICLNYSLFSHFHQVSISFSLSFKLLFIIDGWFRIFLIFFNQTRPFILANIEPALQLFNLLSQCVNLLILHVNHLGCLQRVRSRVIQIQILHEYIFLFIFHLNGFLQLKNRIFLFHYFLHQVVFQKLS